MYKRASLYIARSSAPTLDWRPIVRMASKDRNESVQQEENIIIVGGGIGGLTCALALHRVGLKAVVFEQAESLRSGGSSITLWDNAFRVLDVLGLGEQLRAMFINLAEWEVLDARGKPLASVVIADCEGGPHDVRAVERRSLLEGLAGALPQGAIRFNSRVTALKKLETSPTGATQVELQDGSTYSAKAVIGYDGVSSTIGSWMRLEKPQLVGHVGVRGVAVFPDGHKFPPKAQYFLGKGVRTAYLPMTATKVYWFLVWNSWAQGWQNMTHEQIKEETLQVSKPFHPTEIHLLINHTPLESFWKSTIRQRLNKNPSETLVVGNVTVAGDACHPITPNMGQGGAMAMEDAFVLARKLHGALKSSTGTEQGRVHQALVEYQEERHERVYSMATESYNIGRVLQSGWTVVDCFRDWLLIPRSLKKETFLTHALFDIGELPGQS